MPALVYISPRKTLLETPAFVPYTGQVKWGRDLLKFNLSVKDIELRRKRKPPKQRIEPIDVKKAKLELHEDSNEKEENQLHNYIHEGKEVVKMANDKSTQTLCSKVELASKIETMVLKNELKMSTKKTDSRIVSNLSCEVIGKDSQLMKHFTDLSSLQFNILFEFLNDICPLDELTYWSCSAKKLSKVSCKLPEWSSKEKLFIYLLQLKKGFTIKTLSILLNCPGKKIKETSIRDIFTTYSADVQKFSTNGEIYVSL